MRKILMTGLINSQLMEWLDFFPADDLFLCREHDFFAACRQFSCVCGKGRSQDQRGRHNHGNHFHKYIHTVLLSPNLWGFRTTLSDPDVEPLIGEAEAGVRSLALRDRIFALEPDFH